MKSQTVETVNLIKHLSVCSIWTWCLLIFSLENAFYWLHASILPECNIILQFFIHPSIRLPTWPKGFRGMGLPLFFSFTVLQDYLMYFHSITSRRQCNTRDYSTCVLLVSSYILLVERKVSRLTTEASRSQIRDVLSQLRTLRKALTTGS